MTTCLHERRRALALAGAATTVVLIAGCSSHPTSTTAPNSGSGRPGSTASSASSPRTSASNPAPSGATSSNPAASNAAPPGASCGDAAAAPPAPTGLVGVQFVSATTGWAVGSSGVLATTDGGAHWSTQYPTQSPGLDGLDFVDADHGWALGADTIVATADGVHWQQLAEPCPRLRSVHFVDPEHGYAAAGGNGPTGGVLLETADGGRSWQPMSAPADVQSVCFDPQGNGWLGAGGHIYAYSNGSWTLREQGYPSQGGEGLPTVELECAGHGTAWAELVGPGVGMSQQEHVGYHTAGTTWTPIFSEQYYLHPPQVATGTNSPGSYAGPFSAISPTQAVFVDYCPACTPDAMAPAALATGAHLVTIGDVAGVTQPSGASFLSAKLGWVVGTLTNYAHQPVSRTTVIVHTTDGGHTWTTQYSAALPNST